MPCPHAGASRALLSHESSPRGLNACPVRPGRPLLPLYQKTSVRVPDGSDATIRPERLI